jgi:hypothetical protein
MSYNEQFVFFNIPGGFSECQKRSMNYELYHDDGSRSNVIVACEDACEGDRLACTAECRADANVCRGVCNGVRDVCYVPCGVTAGTCEAGCFVGLGACDVGCEVFCLFAPNSNACKDCRSACQSGRTSCERGCENTRQSCRGGCEGIASGCRGLCDSGPCEGDCRQDAKNCLGDFPERPIGPPGVVLPVFLRGEANADRTVDISDGAFILDFLFDAGIPPPCMDAADVDDNGKIELTDAIRLFGFLFLGGPVPATPGAQTCGTDPSSDDAIGCNFRLLAAGHDDEGETTS